MSFIDPQENNAGILAIVVGICALGLALGLLVLVSDFFDSPEGTNDNYESHIKTVKKSSLKLAKSETNDSNTNINTTGSDLGRESPIVNLIGGYEPQDAAKTLPVWQKCASMGMVYFDWQQSAIKPLYRPNCCAEYWETTLFEHDSEEAEEQTSDSGLQDLMGIDGIVPIAEKGYLNKDTVAGEIIFSNNICEGDLPLCITEDYLNDDPNTPEVEGWIITADAYGGYEPGTWATVLHQIKVYQGYWAPWDFKKVHKGTIDITWSTGQYIADCCNHYQYYVTNFDIVWSSGPDQNKICLDSNRWPTISGGIFGTDVDHDWPSDFIPGKKVTLVGESEWQGCSEVDQRFTLISARGSPLISHSCNPQ